MSFERAILERALRRLGSPYLWAAKGEWAVRSGVAVPTQSLGIAWACDCSGLLTTAIHEAGGPDLRATWGSDRIHTLPAPQDDEDLRIGWWPAHVGLMLGKDTPLCLESAGGDQRTLMLADALNTGARVMLGWATHGPPKAVHSLRSLLAAHP